MTNDVVDATNLVDMAVLLFCDMNVFHEPAFFERWPFFKGGLLLQIK